MKKLIITLALIINTNLAFSMVEFMKDEEKEYVEVVEETESLNRERSLSNIECYILRDLSQIEIQYIGIESPLVFICDSYGNIYNYQYTSNESGKVTLELPNIPGLYQIVVQSEVYKGIGVFSL